MSQHVGVRDRVGDYDRRSRRHRPGGNVVTAFRHFCRVVVWLRHRRMPILSAEPTWLTEDPEFEAQFAALREIALTYTADGVDLREVTYAIAIHPLLKRWLQRSDAIVDELAGSERLRKRRRYGILRHLYGPMRGLPFFQPSLELYRKAGSLEPRVYPLWDELEVVVLPGRIDEFGWRPIKDEITFDELRAWTELRAGTLYAHTSKRQIPGQTWRILGNDPDKNLHELRFHVEDVRGWAMVSDRSSRRAKGASG